MFIRTSHTHAGAAALDYIKTGVSMFADKTMMSADHNILTAEQNMLPDSIVPWDAQMKQDWRHDDNPRHLCEVRRIIISFAPDEINPAKDDDGFFADPMAPQKALEVAMRYIADRFPDRKAAFAVQCDGHRSRNKDADGKTHPVLHVHACVSDWSMVDGKGVPAQFNNVNFLAHDLTDFCSNYTYECTGEAFTATKNQEQNLENLDRGYRGFGKKLWRNSDLTEILRKSGEADRLVERDGKFYYASYKDYLTDKLQEGLDQFSNFPDLEDFLKENGIEIDVKSTKKQDHFFKYRVRDEFLYRKDADNTTARAISPKTNNASIGEDRLSKYTDMGLTYVDVVNKLEENRKRLEAEHENALCTEKEYIANVLQKALTCVDLAGFEDEIRRSRVQMELDEDEAIVYRVNDFQIGEAALSEFMGVDVSSSGIAARINENEIARKEAETVQNAPEMICTPHGKPLISRDRLRFGNRPTGRNKGITEPVKQDIAKPEAIKPVKRESKLSEDEKLRIQFHALDLTGGYHGLEQLEKDMIESDRRYAEFKRIYPDDYAERILNGDISTPAKTAGAVAPVQNLTQAPADHKRKNVGKIATSAVKQPVTAGNKPGKEMLPVSKEAQAREQTRVRQAGGTRKPVNPWYDNDLGH